MVDTALRPRPAFSTFLLSDQNTGGDGLSYYNYKKLVRSQKVALLQQKRQEARIPGQIFRQTPNVHKPNVQQQQCPQATVSKEDQYIPKHSDIETQTPMVTETKTDSEETHPVHYTTRQSQPNNACQYRLSAKGRVKSARVVSRQSGDPQNDTALYSTRPKTAGVVQDKLWKLSPPEASSGGINECEEPADSHQVHTDEDIQQHNEDKDIQDVPDVPSLVKCFMWTSATKKAYNEVGWDNKLPHPISPPSSISAKTVPPDPVSMKFRIKRYETYPQSWQSVGGTGTWDIAQDRPTSGYQRPNDKNIFRSPFRYTRQLPGYQGFTRGEPDSIVDGNVQSYNVTSYQPRPTKISRRPNIPGYMGCTLWSNSNQCTVGRGYPKPTNNLQSYGEHAVDENISPFIRKSVLSKMVSLNTPYNPFNKIEPVH